MLEVHGFAKCCVLNGFTCYRNSYLFWQWCFDIAIKSCNSSLYSYLYDGHLLELIFVMIILHTAYCRAVMESKDIRG